MHKLWKIYFEYSVPVTQAHRDRVREAAKKRAKEHPSWMDHGYSWQQFEPSTGEKLIIVHADDHKNASDSAAQAAARWTRSKHAGEQWSEPVVTVTRVEIFKNADDIAYEFALV